MHTEESQKAEMLQAVFDVMPSLVFVVDDDVRIHEYNAAAGAILQEKREAVLQRRGGDVLHCLHAYDVPEGCGRGPFCRHCVIRTSVGAAFTGNRVVRRRTKIELLLDGEKRFVYALISASPFRFQDKSLVLLVIEDVSDVAELQSLITICSFCKEIKDEKETWYRLETFFKERWGVDFSHGLCPKCFEQLMGKSE